MYVAKTLTGWSFGTNARSQDTEIYNRSPGGSDPAADRGRGVLIAWKNIPAGWEGLEN